MGNTTLVAVVGLPGGRVIREDGERAGWLTGPAVYGEAAFGVRWDCGAVGQAVWAESTR